jgi:hypothetical protein
VDSDVQIAAVGFRPDTEIMITIAGIPRDSVHTDNSGGFMVDRNIPATLAPGVVAVVASGGGDSAIASLTLTPHISPGSDFPLDLVITNESMREFFLENRQFVHPGDSFLVVSGNSDAKQNRVTIDTAFINQTASMLHKAFNYITVYAVTAGSLNVRRAADDLNRNQIRGIMIVWEPDRPDHPDSAFDRGNLKQVMRVTRKIWNPLREYSHQRNFELWGKPSGRATRGGSKQGVYDYGEMAQLTDGLNVQTQGACQDGTGRFRRAINGLISDYNRVGASGVKGLFPQVTVSTTDQNSVTPTRGLNCSEYAWSRMPPVTRVTMWWASEDRTSVRRFLQRREGLFSSAAAMEVARR